MSKQNLDPLGQSFFVDSPIFVTKVDLFFAEKDDTLPIVVKIRKNDGGQPSPFIVPLSEKIVSSANVLISSNANVATTVTFDAPIYLDIGEYTLTLGSSSKNYKVWISELNQEDVLTERNISEQPLLGSLFKSQNASEWTASQFEDLKLRIYKAQFYTNVTSTVNLTPVRNYTSVFFTESQPFEIYPGRTTLKVFHFDHGLVENSYVMFTNFANANISGTIGNVYGIDGNLLDKVEFIVSNVKLDSFTIDLPNAPNVTEVTRFGSGSSMFKDIAYTSVTPQVGTLKPANTTINHRIITTTATSSAYTVDSTFSDIANLSETEFENLKTFTGVTNSVKMLANVDSLKYRVEMSTNNPDVSPILDLKQAGILLKRNLINNPTYNTSVLSHEVVNIANSTAAGNVTVTLLSGNVGLVGISDTAVRDNVNAIVEGSIITLSANVANPNDGQYRVISILDNGANVRVAKLTTGLNTDAANVYNVINSPSFIAEEAAEGGTSYSKYITKQVDLNNPSTSIRFILDVAKPANSNLEFYYKTKLAGDNTNFDSLEYTKVNDVTITTSLGGEYYEYTKQVDDIAAFNSIVFKIVFLADNEAQVPKIKNFRLIALE